MARSVVHPMHGCRLKGVRGSVQPRFLQAVQLIMKFLLQVSEKKRRSSTLLGGLPSLKQVIMAITVLYLK